MMPAVGDANVGDHVMVYYTRCAEKILCILFALRSIYSTKILHRVLLKSMPITPFRGQGGGGTRNGRRAPE